MTHSLQDKIDLSPSFSLKKSDQLNMQYYALLVIMLRDLFWFTDHAPSSVNIINDWLPWIWAFCRVTHSREILALAAI